VTHFAPGDHAPQIHTSRRSYSASGSVPASSPPPCPRCHGTNVSALQSSSGIEEDRELMKLAMALELTARDLYDLAAAAGADPQ
jgi:hypothetical protein